MKLKPNFKSDISDHLTLLKFYNILKVLIQDNLLTVCKTLINAYYLISQTIMEKMLNMKFINST